jgi:hypothetical protein
MPIVVERRPGAGLAKWLAVWQALEPMAASSDRA